MLGKDGRLYFQPVPRSTWLLSSAFAAIPNTRPLRAAVSGGQKQNSHARRDHEKVVHLCSGVLKTRTPYQPNYV